MRELNVTLTFPRQKAFSTDDINTLRKYLPELPSEFIKPHFSMTRNEVQIVFTENENTIQFTSPTQNQLIHAIDAILMAFHKNRSEKLNAFGRPVIESFAQVSIEERTEISCFFSIKSRALFPLSDMALDLMEEFEKGLIESTGPTKGLGLFDRIASTLKGKKDPVIPMTLPTREKP